MNGASLAHCAKPVYLGTTLDRSLTFHAHCEKTNKKISTRNNVIRMLAGSTWGANADKLRTSPLALVYSTAEYCCPSWEKSAHVKMIDAQLHTTMRIITGTLQSTPLAWLPVLSNIAPPDIRREAITDALVRKISINQAIPL